MNQSEHNQEESALFVLRRLREEGYDAYFAGGCVRDRLLGTVPKDHDVATSATPEQVNAIFSRSRKIGAKFGVILVRKWGFDIEVATFRTEGTYSDGRRPDNVAFANAEEDAQRRDFTINGLFFDPLENRIIDFVGGQSDLQQGVLRTIGDPFERFAEDHLRMLRAVRFAARLEFEIHADTFNAIRKLATRLEEISPERIWMELQQILTAPCRKRGWQLMIDTGLHHHLAPHWPCEDTTDLVLSRLECSGTDRIDEALALSLLLCDTDSEIIEKLAEDLRLSNKLWNDTKYLLVSLITVRKNEDMELADLKDIMAHEQWKNLLELLRIDEQARTGTNAASIRIASWAAKIHPSAIKPPPLLTGHDLLDMGVKPDRRFGEIMQQVYRAQLNEEIVSHEQARALAKQLISK